MTHGHCVHMRGEKNNILLSAFPCLFPSTDAHQTENKTSHLESFW